MVMAWLVLDVVEYWPGERDRARSGASVKSLSGWESRGRGGQTFVLCGSALVDWKSEEPCLFEEASDSSAVGHAVDVDCEAGFHVDVTSRYLSGGAVADVDSCCAGVVFDQGVVPVVVFAVSEKCFLACFRSRLAVKLLPYSEKLSASWLDFLISQLITRAPSVVKVDCRQFSEALLKAVGRAPLTVSASVTGPAVVVVEDVLPAAAGLSTFGLPGDGRRTITAATIAPMTTRAIGPASRAWPGGGNGLRVLFGRSFYNSLWGNICEATLKSLVGSSSAKPNPPKYIAAIQKSSNSRRGI
ncbi:hypothetical protein AS032_34945 [Rhodococcus qingshengii]|nr:hypothetical protein AOT96_32320 [Rhodococcus sp. 008]KSU57584.1 hypothetical protein AS032_34945 [Rhodococcus qingshengii]